MTSTKTINLNPHLLDYNTFSLTGGHQQSAGTFTLKMEVTGPNKTFVITYRNMWSPNSRTTPSEFSLPYTPDTTNNSTLQNTSDRY
jgi:hypothetical protein